jgi:hypothetical protein
MSTNLALLEAGALVIVVLARNTGLSEDGVRMGDPSCLGSDTVCERPRPAP